MTSMGRMLFACFASLIACALIPQLAVAQAPPPGVFAEIQSAVVPRPSSALEPGTVRSRVVQVDTQRITAARRGREVLKLNLFDDEVVEVAINRVRPTRSGYFISGRPRGMEWGEVRLVVNGPVMVGTVDTPEGRFTIRLSGRGRHIIRQIDPAKEPFECEEVTTTQSAIPASPPERAISSVDRVLGLAASPVIQANDMPTEDGSEVRVLIVYTPALQAEQGGAAGMKALIDLFVQSANHAFEESGINPRLVLAHSAMVDYVAADPNTDLHRLANPYDGYMDEVRTLRNKYSADLVHLLTNVKTSVAGIAFLMTSETLTSESRGFALSAVDDERVFTHEIGHNFGAAHDRFVERFATIYPYAFGYVNEKALEPDASLDARWFTVMAYPNRCRNAGISCERLLRFSNPDQSYLGDPLGVPADRAATELDGPADTRLTLNNTARWVGSFRSEACADFSVTPATPIALVGGGELGLRVDSAPGCLWEGFSESNFLTVISDVRMSGSEILRIRVEANPTGAERSGTVTVAGKTVTVLQLATDKGICGRTPAVVLEIMEQISHFNGPGRCDEVAAADLARVENFGLHRRGIRSLKSGDFEGLSGLRSLYLGDNELNEFPESLFAGLSSLEYLVLAGNGLTDLPVRAFAGLSKLQVLRLDGNELTSLPASLFFGLDALEALHMHSNRLTYLTSATFAGMSSLKDLRLEGNELARLPERAFAGLAKLERLDLLNNQLTDLPPGLFAGLSNLEYVRLWENQLSDLPSGLFAGLSSLKELILGYNDLTELPPGLFADLSNLEFLVLGGNRLTGLPSRAFEGLQRLKVLDLWGNELTTLPVDVFSGLTALENVELHINNLTTLPKGVFSGLFALKRLILSRNQISYLPDGVFSDLTALQKVLLNENQLAALPDAVFAGLTALKEIRLHSNRLTTVPEGVFSDLTALQALYLSYNDLVRLPDGIFAGVPRIETLYLEGNKVHPLPLPISLEKVGESQFKAVAPTGVPVDTAVPVFVGSGGTIEGEASTLTITAGALKSAPVAINRVDGMGQSVSVEIGMLPRVSGTHRGYTLDKTGLLPLPVLPSIDGTDAALSDLSAVEGALEPAFTPDQTSYAVYVANEVSSVTVTPTTSNPSATVAFLDANGQSLVDADANTEGYQVDLNAGENTIRVKVTSEDGTAATIYTLLVTRDAVDGICARTKQVRDAIMAAVSDIRACTEVTETNLSQIMELDLKAKNISSLKSGDFSKMTALRRIHLDNNQLESLPPNVFSGLSNLKFLALSDNRLEGLPVDVFSGLSNLQKLWMSQNRVRALPEGVFAGLPALKSLLMSNNRLESLTSDLFSDLPVLETLRVAGNPMTSLPANVFSGLTELKYLILGDQLESLPVEIFSDLRSLKSVWLTSNRLESLPSSIFAGLSDLEDLLLRVNLVSLPPSIFSGLTSLRRIDLLGNGLSSLPPGIFSGLTSLRALNLMENELRVLPAGVFSGLSQIEELRLGYNTVHPLLLPLSLEKVGENEINAIAPTGAPFSLDLPIEISSSGTIDADTSAVTIPAGSVESELVEVKRVPGTEDAVTVDFGPLPALPENHTGYSLQKDESLPIVILPGPRAPAPAPVTGVEISPDVEQLEVTWTAVSDAGGYKVQWKSGDGPYDESRQTFIGSGDSVRYRITGLTSGTEYTVRVIATKEDADDGPPSNEVTAIPLAAPAPQVGDVVVTAAIQQLEVSWAALPDVSGYKVQWKSGEEDYDESRQALITGGGTVSYTIADLVAGTEYTVRVRATRENANDGFPSSEVVGIPKTLTLAPVTGVEVEVGVEQLAVSWTAVSDASGYKVQWQSGEEAYDKARQTVITGGDTVSYTIAGLSAGTEYTVRVIATREHAEDGEPSSEVLGIPKSLPPALVTGVEITAGIEQLDVSWVAVSDAGGYKVQWKSGEQAYAESRQAVITDGATVSHTITDLAADTQYTVRVMATKDNADDGLPSAEVMATPTAVDPDVNGDGMLNGDDALVMYHAYASASQVGDGETGGTAASRQTLLSGLAGLANPSDEDLKAMIRKAHGWRESGVDAGGDVNEDGAIDESDAFVMYYAYELDELVGDGEMGGTVRFRQLLLAAFASQPNPSDEDFKAMLRRANALREEFG